MVFREICLSRSVGWKVFEPVELDCADAITESTGALTITLY